MSILGALVSENNRLKAVLQEIADAQPPAGDCTCGHAPEFCHKRNANRWCGGIESWTIWKAREALAPSKPVPQSATRSETES